MAGIDNIDGKAAIWQRWHTCINYTNIPSCDGSPQLIVPRGYTAICWLHRQRLVHDAGKTVVETSYHQFAVHHFCAQNDVQTLADWSLQVTTHKQAVYHAIYTNIKTQHRLYPNKSTTCLAARATGMYTAYLCQNHCAYTFAMSETISKRKAQRKTLVRT